MNPAMIPKDAFDSGLLSRDYHDRLIADLENIVKRAGVPVSAVWSRLSQLCDADCDYEWVRAMRFSEDGGMAYIGKPKGASVEDRMRGIVGACLRNYTNARMMTVQDVLARLKSGDMPDPTLLLIPNFCMDKADGGDIPTWQVSELLGLLIERASMGKKTVLYAPSWTALEKQYGTSFCEHIKAYYAVYEKGAFSQPAGLTYSETALAA